MGWIDGMDRWEPGSEERLEGWRLGWNGARRGWKAGG
jgi:hypothetical protein